jgi:hypothetical protein
MPKAVEVILTHKDSANNTLNPACRKMLLASV